MNVRDNKVKEPTKDHKEPSTQPAPASPTTPVPDNQLDDVHPDASPRLATPNRLRETWVPIMNLVIGFLALVVIAFQAIIYNEQRKIMNTQSKFMQMQTQIMEKSFGLSEKSLRTSERAYVGVAKLNANLTDGQISIALSNTGNVPATAVRVEADVYRVAAASNQSELKNDKTSKVLWDAGAVPLFPGNFRMSVVIDLQNFNQEEGKDVMAKKETLYIGGTIRYEDRNGNAESTPFAHKYDPLSDTWMIDSDLSKFFDKNKH